MMNNKYSAQKSIVDGISFDSKLEAERYKQLMLLRQAGEISDLNLQFEFQIFHGFVDPDTGIKEKSSFYRADFVYLDIAKKQWIAEDTKGIETAEFKLKWKLVKQQYPEYKFRKLTKSDI